MKVDIVKQAAQVPSSELGDPVAAGTPIGEPVAQMSTLVLQTSEDGDTAAGIWEYTPGKFRRAVKQAEMSHFLAGRCSFTPEGAETIEIRPGDMVYFPSNSQGVWDIEETVRKTFFVCYPKSE